MNCSPVDNDAAANNLAAYLANSSNSSLATQLYNDFFNGLMQAVGLTGVNFVTSTTTLPQDAASINSDGAYVRSDGEVFYAETVGSTIYLSPYAMKDGIEGLAQYIGHELAHAWLNEAYPTLGANVNFSEAVAFFYQAKVDYALGLDSNGDLSINTANQYYSGLGSLQSTYEQLTTQQNGYKFPTAPNTPC